MTTSFASSHEYPVVDDQTVSLTVVIGQGALGSTIVLLDGNHVGAGTGIKNFPVGQGQDVRGKLLIVTSSMVAAHSLTSEQVALDGGSATQTWTDQHAGNAGDNVVYTCTVLFT
jgi:hypothetical protein